MLFSPLTGWRYFAAFVGAMIVFYSLAYFLGIRIKTYFSQSRVEKWFARRSGLLGNFLAALFGAITPFCSCTTVPIFSGMLESNIKLGYAMSFLIASPTINPPAMILLWTLFGLNATLIYSGAVFLAAILGGRVLGPQQLSRYVFDIMVFSEPEEKITWREAVHGWGHFLKGFIGIILLAGLLATLLKGWMPSEKFLLKFSHLGYAAVPLLVGLGIFIYSDIILLIPIAHSLMQKGIPEGTVFAFIMAASGVGLPSLLLLSKILHKKLILYYLAVLTILLVVLGYLLNIIL